MVVRVAFVLLVVGMAVVVLDPISAIFGTKRSVSSVYLLCSSYMTGQNFQGLAHEMRGNGVAVISESSGVYRVGYGTFTTRWLCEVRVDAEGKVLSQRRL